MKSESVDNLVDRSNVECYNEDGTFRVGNVLDKSDTYLQSDVGHELLIHIPFSVHVRSNSVTLTCFPDETCPNEIKIFTERPMMTIDEAQVAKPVQAVSIDGAQAGSGFVLPLKPVLFQNVSTFSVYIASNHGGDKTRIKSISFCGAARGALNMADFKRTG